MHYSWDFAQQLHYPYEDQQVGPIYFKTPRRAQLFGVCCEGIPRQVNYLIDEADFIEKNANTVISLLDHFFDNHGVGEKHVYLTADNCVGLHCNNAVLHYLMYRVLMGLHDRIELSFMLVGLTLFAPDGYFGLIKQKYRRSKIYTYEQLAKIIEESSEPNICQCYRNGSDLPNLSYKDWSTWFSKYFKKLPNLTKYHHCNEDHRELGVVKVKEEIDSTEKKYTLLNKKFPFNFQKQPRRLPKKLEPTGLSLARAWYLYEKIREHIPTTEDKDATCPKPNLAKPSN